MTIFLNQKDELESRVQVASDIENEHPSSLEEITNFSKDVSTLRNHVEHLFQDAKRLVGIGPDQDLSKMNEMKYLHRAQVDLQNIYDELNGEWVTRGHFHRGVLKVFYQKLKTINAQLEPFARQQS